MLDLDGNPKDGFSQDAAQMCKYNCIPRSFFAGDLDLDLDFAFCLALNSMSEVSYDVGLGALDLGAGVSKGELLSSASTAAYL